MNEDLDGRAPVPATTAAPLTPEDEVHFWLSVREALLLLIDVIERYKTRTQPRTSEIRRQAKNVRIQRS